MRGHPFGGALAALFLSLSAFASDAANASSSSSSHAPQWQQQSYFFSWDPASASLPTPVTKQCDTLEITWTRGAATGPDPQAPYQLRIFTSSHTTPYLVDVAGDVPMFNLTIPFDVGTQFEICMFDSLGSTGGCQAIYTVVDGSTACLSNTPPGKYATQLSANSTGAQGLLSQYGWPDSCTNVTVTAAGGTPPYKMMVAPALHPPLHLESNDHSISWQVSLSWASPFFISFEDSKGLMWSHGPLHSGGGGTTSCLNTDFVEPTVQPPKSTAKTISPGVLIGTAVGGLVLGAALAIVIPLCTRRLLARREPPFLDVKASGAHEDTQALRPSHRRDDSSPFTARPYIPPQPGSPAMSPMGSPMSSMHAQAADLANQVYVIHQDASYVPHPVSLVVGRDARVTELPPQYGAAPPGRMAAPPRGMRKGARF